MKTKKKAVRSDLAYFGITKVSDKALVPDGMYLIEREREGTWLMFLKHMQRGEAIHVGVVDLLEVICVANKSHLANLKNEEFYEALEKLFGVNLVDKLYATQDIETVFSRVASHSKQSAYKWPIIGEKK